jgi:carbonic anhydrase/acetyltransferase-like protein (isoleucine patch superfamily)
MGDGASVWPAAVVRADNEQITLGARTNVQDGAILHADAGVPLTIGDDVSIGHQAMLHGCTIGDGSMIGIQAVIMNRAVIGKECLVGAGAIVTEGKSFPDRSLLLGAPAKVVRELTEKDVAFIRWNADDYKKRQEAYKTQLKAVD